MNFLLISLQKELDVTGLKSLHYSLLNNGCNSSILHLPKLAQNDKRQLEEIKRFIDEKDPSVIGISLMSHEYHKACYLTSYLKSFFKYRHILWGGIHPTISPEDCLDYADYVCIGEGERTILNVANAVKMNKSLKDIGNLCYLENGSIKRNPRYPLIENLDELPVLDHISRNSYILISQRIEKLNKKNFKRFDRNLGRVYSIVTTRGCPFSCTYCCNSFFANLYGSSKIRKRSVENIIKELAGAIKNNSEIEYVSFQDDCFLTGSNEYLRDFCKSYKEKVNKPFKILSIPIYISVEKLELLKNAGLAWITLGLQSGSDRILKEVYKRKSFKRDFLEGAKVINSLKLGALYDVITDNPFETEADALETINTLIETPKPFATQFFSLTLYPGTELYKKIKTQFPKYIDDYHEKEYLIVRKSAINNLIRLSTFINAEYMKALIRLYKRYPKGLRFKTALFVVNLLSILIFEPLTYFQTMKLSQRGSYRKTFGLLFRYFIQVSNQFIYQFRNQ